MVTDWETQCQQLADERAWLEEQSAWQREAGCQVQYRFRWEHVQQVVLEAQHLARLLNADQEIATAAAWLHDICKVEPNHGVRGAAAAAEFLASTSFCQEKVPAVAHAIRHHAGLFRRPGATPLTPVDTAILWDADKLTKLGVSQIAMLLCGPHAQRHTLAERRDQVHSYVFSWIDRTVESMNTEPARQLAGIRYAQMQDVLALWVQAPGNAPPTPGWSSNTEPALQ